MAKGRSFRNRKSGNAKNVVSNVRVVDEYAGSAGARLDRILASIQNSHSQTRLICGDYYGINSSTTAAVNRVISQGSIFATDDFTSMAAQFETYRVVAVRYDVYILGTQSGYAAFSTFHDDTIGVHSNFTIDQTIDGPDSQVPSAGQGKIQLTWMATGTAENQFLPTGGALSTSFTDFGGLRASLGTTSVAASPAYQIVMKAVVDFRGRT